MNELVSSPLFLPRGDKTLVLFCFYRLFSARQYHHVRQDSSSLITSDDDAVAGNGSLSVAERSHLHQSSTSPVAMVEWLHFLASTYAGFLFWTFMTGLPCAIWYFPLWNMGLSGHEAFLFSNYVPALLLGLPWIGRRIPIIPLHFLTVLGLCAYLWKDPVSRLIVWAIGTMASTTAWFQLFRAQNARLDRDIYAWLCGLVLHMVVKAAWQGNNPFWPVMKHATGGKNEIGIALALVSTVILAALSQAKTMSNHRPKSSSPAQVKYKGNSVLAAFGLGALFFNIHCLFTDSTTVLRWAVDGYPGMWLAPVPWGAVTILSCLVGIAVSHRRFVYGPAIHALGTIAAFGMYYLPEVVGDICAWILGFYVFAVAPGYVHAIAVAPTGRTLLMGLFYWDFLMLANVWTVAYEFVPLGEYLRESSGVIIAWTVFGMLLGGWNASAVHYGHHHESSSVDFPANRRRLRRFLVKKVLYALAIAAIFVYGFRFVSIERNTPSEPRFKDDKVFTAGIWTIHFALDNDMWASERRIQKVVQDMDLDVIGLLESDVQRIITGNRDLGQSLAEPLGYYADYGPGPSKHTWGCTLLSRFPILNSTHHLLPSPVGELACAIHATLLVHGREIDVVVSHNGQNENWEDRLQQTTELSRLMRESQHRPTVFLGYVVTKPKDTLHNMLMYDGKMTDVELDDWDRWCQYILFRGVKRIGYARLSHGIITDTYCLFSSIFADFS